MAEIYLATSRGPSGFEKTVVIKRLKKSMGSEQGFVRMFLSEAMLVARLSHPNVVQIHELGEDDGLPYIVMEYVPGVDCREIVKVLEAKQSALPLELALYVTSEVLKGLGHAHRATGADGQPLGVVHCDVKPSNVLISTHGEVKVTDFGVAFGNHCPQQPDQGPLVGTFSYMSPEQIARGTVDARSDVFCVGAFLAELLTGRRLFDRQSVAETLRSVFWVRLDNLQRHELELPQEVMEILQKALRQRADERYETAAAFRQAIAAYLDDSGYRVSSESLAAYLSEHVQPHLPPRPHGARGQGPTTPMQDGLLAVNDEVPTAPVDPEKLKMCVGKGAPPAGLDGPINCWQYLGCGREIGGDGEPCPAILATHLDGMNRGHAGGRMCWYVAGTLCGGDRTGTFAAKRLSCLTCAFYEAVYAEEGPLDFKLIP